MRRVLAIVFAALIVFSHAQALPWLIKQQGLDQGLPEFHRRNQGLLRILAIIAGARGTTSQVCLPVRETYMSEVTAEASADDLLPLGISRLT
jgi:hypothetical protein